MGSPFSFYFFWLIVLSGDVELNPGPTLDDKPEVALLLDWLGSLSEWKSFGLHLPEIKPHHVCKIFRENSTIDDMKIALFAKWIAAYPKAKWRDVIKALKKIEENTLAHDIQYKLRGHHSSTPSLTLSESGDSAVQSMDDTASPFSPQEQTTKEITFLSCKIEEMTIHQTIKELHETFTDLLTKVRIAFENKPLTIIHEIVLWIQTYMASLNMKWPPNDDIMPDNVKDIFNKIFPYYDFIDCELIVDLTKKYLQNETDLVSHLIKHQENGQNLMKSTSITNLKSKLREIYRPFERNFSGMPIIRIQLQDVWYELNIKKLEILVRNLLPIHLKQSLMKYITIESGSVRISYAVIELTTESLLKHFEKKLELLPFIGIFGLTINEHVVLSSFNQGEDKDFNFELSFLNAVETNHYEAVDFLIKLEVVNVNYRNELGNTALILASQNGHHKVVEILLEKQVDPNVQNQEGVTALMLASQNGHLKVIELLLNFPSINLDMQRNDGLTALMLGGSQNIQVLKLLYNYKCDLNIIDKRGMTLLHHIAVNGNASVLDYLINECNCDPMVTDKEGMTPLHHAVQNSSNLSTVECLISTGKCDLHAKDSSGQTPLELASKTEYGKELYLPLFHKFGQIKTSHPVDSYVNVLLLGNPGAGKSTLNKVITETATGSVTFGSFRTVKGVELYTAGIIPTKLQHKQLGNIILHDFAGRSEYYSSHTAVIENLLQGSAGVFVLVVNIKEKEALKHLQQWLTVVRNETQKALGQCRIIVVASHVDEMTRNERKEKMIQIQKIITERCDSEEVVSVLLDCRKLVGASTSSFLKSLSHSCQFIRNASGKNLTLYCHMMYALLEELKQNVVILSDITEHIKDDKTDFILPKEKDEILKVLTSLHSTGLICLLQSEDEVWVVVNKQILLAEVNGILFAPKTFKQYHTGIVSNTGIMTVSTLGELFSNYDTNMLICFFKNMSLCQEIHPDFKAVTNLHQLTEGTEEKLLFFPALLDIGRPDVAEIKEKEFQFGWCLQCTKEHHHFFPPRYFHLSLQLAYKLASPQSSDKLNRHCTFWRNGVHWYNGHGIGTLVEMVNDSQCVLVLMSSEEGYRQNMVSARRDVIREIMTVYKESCPSVEVEKYVIDPQELTYPIDNPTTERTVYSVKDIIQCIKEEKPFVMNTSSTKHREVKELLTDERYDECSSLSILGERDVKELESMLSASKITRSPPERSFAASMVSPQQERYFKTSSELSSFNDIDDIVDIIMNHSHHVRWGWQWEELVRRLGLSSNTLIAIEEKCGHDSRQCLTECLIVWLLENSSEYELFGRPRHERWHRLVDVFRRMGENEAAFKLELYFSRTD